MQMPDEPQPNPDDDKREKQQAEAQGSAPPVTPTVETRLNANVEVVSGQKGKATTTEQNEQKRQRILERAATWQARSAVAIVVLTVGSIYVNYLQWSATDDQYSAMVDSNRVAIKSADAAKSAAEEAKRSNDIAADTAKKQLAPYFVPEARPLVRYDLLTGDCSVKLKIKNAGQTPAFEVEIHHRIAVIPIAGPFELADTYYAGTVGPGREITVPIKGQVDASQRDSIADSKRLLIVKVLIRYRDIFGNEPGAGTKVASSLELLFEGDDPVPDQPGMFELNIAPVGNK